MSDDICKKSNGDMKSPSGGKKIVAIIASLLMFASATLVIVSDVTDAAESNENILDDGLKVSDDQLVTQSGKQLPTFIEWDLMDGVLSIYFNGLTINMQSKLTEQASDEYRYFGLFIYGGETLDKVKIYVTGENNIVLPSAVAENLNGFPLGVGGIFSYYDIEIIGTDPNTDSLKIVSNSTITAENTPSYLKNRYIDATKVSISNCKLTISAYKDLFDQAEYHVNMINTDLLYANGSVVELLYTSDSTPVDKISEFNGINGGCKFVNSSLKIDIASINSTFAHCCGILVSSTKSFDNTNIDIKIKDRNSGTGGGNHVFYSQGVSLNSFTNYKSIKASTDYGTEPTDLPEGTVEISTAVCKLVVETVGSTPTSDTSDYNLAVNVSIMILIALLIASAVVIIIGRTRQ